MTQVTVTLDIDNEVDRHLLSIILKSRENKAFKPPEWPAETDTTQASSPAHKDFPSTKPKAEVAKAMGQIAEQIGKQIGAPNKKMDTKTRASVAAKARWEKFRAIKEGRPIPVKVQKKKKTLNRENDFERAEQRSLNEFPTQRTQDFVMNTLPPAPSFPDGREILEGTFKKPQMPDHIEEEAEFDNPLDEQYLQDIRAQAEKFEREQ